MEREGVDIIHYITGHAVINLVRWWLLYYYNAGSVHATAKISLLHDKNTLPFRIAMNSTDNTEKIVEQFNEMILSDEDTQDLNDCEVIWTHLRQITNVQLKIWWTVNTAILQHSRLRTDYCSNIGMKYCFTRKSEHNCENLSDARCFKLSFKLVDLCLPESTKKGSFTLFITSRCGSSPLQVAKGNTNVLWCWNYNKPFISVDVRKGFKGDCCLGRSSLDVDTF